MTKPTKEVWLSRQQSAWLAKLGVDRFDAAIRPQIETVKRDGRKVLLNGQNVVDAIVHHRAEGGAADPLLAGAGDSQNLERYRAARAAIAEHELQALQKTHVNISNLAGLLLRFTSTIRRGGDILQRRFGNDAAAILTEAIDEAATMVQKELK